jgi:hypothetical protein
MGLRVISATEAGKQKAVLFRLSVPSQRFMPVVYVLLFAVLSMIGIVFIHFYARFFDAGSLEGSSDLIAFIVFITVIIISWKGYQILAKGRD